MFYAQAGFNLIIRSLMALRAALLTQDCWWFGGCPGHSDSECVRVLSLFVPGLPLHYLRPDPGCLECNPTR